MPRAILLAGLSILLIIGRPAAADDWPTFLHDNSRVGATAEQLTAPLAPRWIYSAPAPPQLAWEGPRGEPIEGLVMRHRVAYDRALPVVVAGGRAFFGSSVDHQLYCLDARSGQVQWTFFTEGPIRLAPTIWDGTVYFGSDDGWAYCLDAADGRLIWRQRGGPEDQRLLARGRMISRWPVRTGVLIADGIAYFGAGVFPHETVYLAATDARTGAVLWKNDRISQQDAERNPLSPQGYLLANDTQLIVPSGRMLPAAFDRRTGEQLFHTNHAWRTTAGGEVGGWRALLADGQIYSSGSHHFLAINQKNGATGYAWISGRQLTLAGERGFFATGERLVAVERAPHAAATVERQKYNLERYALRQQRAKLDPKEYQQKDAELAAKIAELSEVGSLWNVPCSLDSALIVAGDWVIAGGAGRVAAYAVADGRTVWQAEVEGEAAALAVADGQLLVSTDAGKIYAFAHEPGGEPKLVGGVPASDQSPYPDDDLSPVYAAAAEQILQTSGVERGFCLVLGSQQGRLAYELARRSQLQIYGIEADAEQVAASRAALNRAGLYGTRVAIVHGDPAQLPFSNYFANVVVSDRLLTSGQLPAPPESWSRCVKPCGGQVCLVTREAAAETPLDEVLGRLDFDPRDRQSGETVAAAVRGKLPGAGDWSHQYGDPGNTGASRDFRIQGGLRVLWYGDPGPSQMINRHEAAAAPLSTAGRMFIQGTQSIFCYDAYNGLFLWEYRNPGALRTGVFNNEEASNLAATEDALLVAVDDEVTELDAATGEVRRVHRLPASPDGLERAWGYVASQDGLLFGTSTVRSELEKALKRRGHTVDQKTDALFAVDLASGQQKWLYRGQNILHVTLAISDGRVFFIDSSISSAEREALLQQDKTELAKLGSEEARRKEEELKRLDVRRAVCLDARTGQQLWSQPVDVTDCSRVGIGGGELTLMAQDGHVLICGANANGHYWKQFLAGDFSRRRLVVLDATDGRLLWAKDANYRHRPLIVGSEIIAEPWAFDLQSGEQKMRIDPLTGQEMAWQFSRPGHHCGPITGAPNMLFFRSGDTAYYDLYSDSGTSHFAGQRLGCWVNAIPGNGLLMIPEASAGCVCQFSIAATVVLEPAAERDSWKIYSSPAGQTPVQQFCVNLGGPGDRRDSLGRLWLSYPRPTARERLEYVFKLPVQLAAGGGYYTENPRNAAIAGVADPWLFASGARGLLRCELPLLGEGDPPASYRVELYFAEPAEEAAGRRVFDIRLQGQTVASAVELTEAAGGSRQPLVQSFADVPVQRELVIELEPRGDQPPVLCAVRVERQE